MLDSRTYLYFVERGAARKVFFACRPSDFVLFIKQEVLLWCDFVLFIKQEVLLWCEDETQVEYLGACP